MREDQSREERYTPSGDGNRRGGLGKFAPFDLGKPAAIASGEGSPRGDQIGFFHSDQKP